MWLCWPPIGGALPTQPALLRVLFSAMGLLCSTMSINVLTSVEHLQNCRAPTNPSARVSGAQTSALEGSNRTVPNGRVQKKRNTKFLVDVGAR